MIEIKLLKTICILMTLIIDKIINLVINNR